jgi:chromatin modification-related protein VID21
LDVQEDKARVNGTETGKKDEDGAAHAADVSSPSSTAGAQSTFTPKALHHSPDTSPEADTFLEQPVTESSKQGEGAADDKDTDASPDIQLRMEEAQANAVSDKDSQRKRPTAINMPPPWTPKRAESQAKMDAAQSSTDVEMKDVSPLGGPSDRKAAPDVTPGRMTTRVASGAIRQKSVSEILGEAPKQSPQGMPSPLSSRRNTLVQTPATPDGFDRSRLSTVVFSKDRDPTSKALHSELDGYLALKGASLDPEKDYLRPLFLHQAWGPPRAEYLHDLLSSTKKTVTSADIYASMREQIDYRILRRIYQLQNSNRWSLRQLAKFQDPSSEPSHLDYMLDEMKWLRTDFKQERKWKQNLARNVAEWCAEYVTASPEEKESLRIKTKLRSTSEIVESPPELVASTGTSEASEEDVPLHLINSVPPMALFSLGYNDLVFEINSTPSGDALLAELPLYDPKVSHQPTESGLPVPNNDNMSAVSKMVTGKLVPKLIGHPRKRSRYEFDQSDDDAGPKHKRTKSSDPSPFLSPARRSSPRSELPPEEQEVSLFNPINKHILDRLRTNHAFRPPSEFPMPSLDFFENRPPSQWTWDEDQRLRHCVRKYSYNWSLIAMDLQAQCQPSKQVSGPERRTPWECFERWFQLEGLPNDMSKTPYFKTYQGRLDNANRALQAQAAAAAAQASSAGTPTAAIRRRTNCQPIRVDRRRDTRHVTMIDAIRKLTRKRENNVARQAEGKMLPKFWLC